ncbi:MAG TPA: methyltransferase domain-containing protein [Mycobacteriales bacterium]|nr:methyltransferase domain-containing protein [Mycobacteriales bacterium]
MNSQVLALFDKVSDRYGEVPFFPPLGEALVEWVDPRDDAWIADLACGRGAIGLSGALRRRRARVVGCDLSSGMTTKSRAAGLRRVVRGDLTHLPLRNSSFDYAFLGFAVNFATDVDACILEVARILKPGGIVGVSTPATAPKGELPGYGDLIARFADFRLPGVWETHNVKTLVPQLTDAGFDSVRVTAVSVPVTYASPIDFWESEMSHGLRGFVESLPDHAADEFRATTIELARDAEHQDQLTIHRGARFMSARLR